MTISLLLIATNNYKRFVQPLIDSVKKHFLKDCNINIHLFTDEKGQYDGDGRVTVLQHIIPSYNFPEATLLRYSIFLSLCREEYDEYMIYLDVDMLIVGDVGTEILNSPIAVIHPGYYNGGWGDKETKPTSLGYVPENLRKNYYAGGFQGGKKNSYYSIIGMLHRNIQLDLIHGIIARWHDESHWNTYVNSFTDDIVALSPSYCMPEAQWKRELWGVTKFEPKILALEKEETKGR